MNHDKDRVLPAAIGMWPEILKSLAGVDDKVFSGIKQPCPLCGGNTRFRYEESYSQPFICIYCGTLAPINFYMELTGIDFSQAINDVGDYLNLIPVERRESINREFIARTKFPSWYKFDADRYDALKSNPEPGIIPLLNRSGDQCDFIIGDVDGWKTTAGNKFVPCGFYSALGSDAGQRIYIAFNPYHAAQASTYTGKQVLCCFDLPNLDSVVNNFPGQECVAIVTNLSETQEADAVRLPQLVFDTKTKSVKRRLWQPFEMSDKRNNENE